MAPSKKSEREAREARERLRRYQARQQVHEHRLGRRKRDNLVAVGAVLVVVAIAVLAQVFYFSSGPGQVEAEPSATPSASASAAPEGENVGEVPDPSVADDRTWTGSLTLNDVELAVEFDGEAAPQAVASFVTSIDDGYYEGKTCHRLVQSESADLIQCGSLGGDGAPDPDYSFGPLENVPEDGLYPAGTIAVARGADAYSQGRQFFITLDDTELDGSTGGYTVLGTVTDGLDGVVDEIAAEGTADGAADGAPTVDTEITAFTIE